MMPCQATPGGWENKIKLLTKIAISVIFLSLLSLIYFIFNFLV